MYICGNQPMQIATLSNYNVSSFEWSSKVANNYSNDETLQSSSEAIVGRLGRSPK